VTTILTNGIDAAVLIKGPQSDCPDAIRERREDRGVGYDFLYSAEKKTFVLLWWDRQNWITAKFENVAVASAHLFADAWTVEGRVEPSEYESRLFRLASKLGYHEELPV
jgi:hypothetical protein